MLGHGFTVFSIIKFTVCETVNSIISVCCSYIDNQTKLIYSFLVGFTTMFMFRLYNIIIIII